MSEEQKSLQWLSAILDTLRKECPWDRVQTIDSLRYLTIEEVFELSEAIASGDRDEMRKELGDLFMHLLFYSKIASDEGSFTTVDVIDGICRKLISRHPHISLPDREGCLQPAQTDVQPQWEKVKMKEHRKSVLEGVPSSLPPLVKTIRMQEKAAGVGFEFSDAEGAHRKVVEEYNELSEALKESDKNHAEEELGDLLFAIVNWGRMQGLNADDALTRTNQKFQQRFRHIEESAAEEGRQISDLSVEEMLAYWREAK